MYIYIYIYIVHDEYNMCNLWDDSYDHSGIIKKCMYRCVLVIAI